MQVRSRDPTGGANQANDVCGIDAVAFLHVDPRHVRKEREDAKSVIDYHRVAAEVEIARDHDMAGVWGLDGHAGGAQKVGARMRVARLAIEDAARAEAAVGGIADRTHEWMRPQACGSRMRV